MEQLLHYVWKHKIFPLMPLQTTSGQPVEVIDPGLPNTDAGPDFFNAKLKINGTLWVGNVELHTQASDWFRHGHNRDTVYDNVILHVVGESDCEVYYANGGIVPQLLLHCPDNVRRRYDELRQTEIYPPCYSILASLPKLTVHSWLSALQVERFEQKAQAIAARLERCNNHWEDVFFITLARNFGFGLNGDAFEAWAGHLPFRAVDKHRDSLFQVEAFFLGQAGLLEEDWQEDCYYRELQKEFHYLQRKFELSAPVSSDRWRFLRLRPGNFPHVRLAQLAWLYHKEQSLFSRVMAVDRTYHNITVHLRIGTNQITAGIVIKVVDGTLLVARQTVHIDFIGIYALSFPVSQAVKIFLLSVKRYRITRRKVEHDNVIQFYFSETRYAFVFPLRPFNVRFGVEYRQSVLCQRHGKRCVRYTRTVAHFTYIQKVTHQQ
jgi:hypothetical protein